MQKDTYSASQNQQNKHYDALVVGGGLSGMQTAISLGCYGMNVAVVDSSTIDDIVNGEFDGRTCAIAYASSNLFKHTGVWEKIEPFSTPMTDIVIEDGDLINGISPLSMHYDSSLVNGQALGYILENITTRRYQYERICEIENIDYFANKTVVSSERNDENASITLSDGTVLVGSVILACDGKFSKIRQEANIKLTNWKYDQTAIVCTVECEKPHDGVAVELFLPSGPFAMLPMQDNRINVIWSEKPDLVKHLLSMDTDEFHRHLSQRFGKWLGNIKVVEDKRFAYPLSLQHAHTYIDNRLALIADAAHAMHPIAGQGLNMGLRDIAALTECFVNAKRNGKDIGSQEILQEYEQYRYADNTSLMLICDGLTRLFSNNNSIIRTGRVLGLGLLNKFRPAKKMFMKHAMGMVGRDIPTLLKEDNVL